MNTFDRYKIKLTGITLIKNISTVVHSACATKIVVVRITLSRYIRIVLRKIMNLYLATLFFFVIQKANIQTWSCVTLVLSVKIEKYSSVAITKALFWQLIMLLVLMTFRVFRRSILPQPEKLIRQIALFPSSLKKFKLWNLIFKLNFWNTKFKFKL